MGLALPCLSHSHSTLPTQHSVLSVGLASGTSGRLPCIWSLIFTNCCLELLSHWCFMHEVQEQWSMHQGSEAWLPPGPTSWYPPSPPPSDHHSLPQPPPRLGCRSKAGSGRFLCVPTCGVLLRSCSACESLHSLCEYPCAQGSTGLRSKLRHNDRLRRRLQKKGKHFFPAF